MSDPHVGTTQKKAGTTEKAGRIAQRDTGVAQKRNQNTRQAAR